MKVGFFLLKFPLSSETFVLNQITAFIDMGFEVEIVALQKGDTENTHAAWTKYNLAARTRWLQDEPTGKVAKLRHRASQTLRGIHRKNTWQALNLKRYGAESRNLILSAICARLTPPMFGSLSMRPPRPPMFFICCSWSRKSSRSKPLPTEILRLLQIQPS